MRPTLNKSHDDLPSLSIRRPVLVLVVNLLVVLAGLSALLAIEVREILRLWKSGLFLIWSGLVP